MKITKSQWEDFWKILHGKSEHFYYDDSDLDPMIDEAATNPAEIFALTTGQILFGGPRELPFEVPGILSRSQVAKMIEEHGGSVGCALPAAIRRYLASLTVVTIVSTIPRDQEENFRRMVSELGGTVQS